VVLRGFFIDGERVLESFREEVLNGCFMEDGDFDRRRRDIFCGTHRD
jgi:hypothetical protein